MLHLSEIKVELWGLETEAVGWAGATQWTGLTSFAVVGGGGGGDPALAGV